jgi:hypothetical protein
MMKESGTSYREVVLEAGEVLGPQQVYCIKNFKDILQVENELVDYDVQLLIIICSNGQH